MPNEDWIYWLAITNVALVVVVLLVALVVAYAVVSELMRRRKKPRAATNMDEELSTMLHGEFAHRLSVPEVGMTMADGGIRVTSLPKQPPEKKPS
jgi:flagellar biosynthesis/type III secretory pathway M-ring protein FliF/YscJ